jgi:hypothetical protein
MVVQIIVMSCSKSADTAPATLDTPKSNFDGKYVRTDSRTDTLVVAVTSNKNSLFYNSRAFRENITVPAHPELQTFEYEFKDGKIGVRLFYSQISSFIYYDFSWVEMGKTFKIQANAIQPDLNNSTSFYTFEKVQ